jgi:hypothetical protein
VGVLGFLGASSVSDGGAYSLIVKRDVELCGRCTCDMRIELVTMSLYDGAVGKKDLHLAGVILA